ncbi:nucleic acid-binding protein [Aspergillus steynii IBT 23096]|uniref:Nucleic acid-binding protein n=1 Tax=Aspergillus steynii IBT 23096 TaxID=1392250 RepID=A0A2I2GBC7_9EURO|nr:nucleic acid-binding protein [Aspergillus steynii IBT 23096]PLB50171.1 nucleic acid-binding protein [Aspergillus steynii IBT 23096]
MSPSNILRAMQPLRSSVLRTVTGSSPAARYLQPSTPSLNSGLASFRRSNSSTTTPPAESQSETSTPLSTPPSLRTYPYTLKKGTVESVGRMDRTVRVSHRHTSWDSHLQKTFPKVTTFLVSDPNNSLREGDVIEFSSGAPKSRTVHHVVERIVAPFGSNIDERPPVKTREERELERATKRAAKWQRRETRRLERGGEGVKEHVGRVKRLVAERTGGGVNEASA